jgi:hypothetical protein
LLAQAIVFVLEVAVTLRSILPGQLLGEVVVFPAGTTWRGIKGKENAMVEEPLYVIAAIQGFAVLGFGTIAVLVLSGLVCALLDMVATI